MDLNLEGMRDRTAAGQWSVDEFDWSEPIEGADGLGPRQLKDAGQMLLFVSGLERRAARIFDLCAHYAPDETTREIYRLFYEDEIRHSEAETRLAARLGVEWKDLPRPTRMAFKSMDRLADWEHRNPFVYDMASSSILLFELALDGILIPVLKERIKDPLQNEIFRRIDVDESRHLAMDYWVLDRKGDPETDWRRELPREAREQMRNPSVIRMYAHLGELLLTLLASFGAMAFTVPTVRQLARDPRHLDGYLARVKRIPHKAPNATNVETFKMSMKGLERILKVGDLVFARKRPHASADASVH